MIRKVYGRVTVYGIFIKRQKHPIIVPKNFLSMLKGGIKKFTFLPFDETAVDF